MINDQDHYAKGWEAGIEQARRILTVRLEKPEEALDMIQNLLIDGYKARREASRRARA